MDSESQPRTPAAFALPCGALYPPFFELIAIADDGGAPTASCIRDGAMLAVGQHEHRLV